jgi:hypothetical protein
MIQGRVCIMQNREPCSKICKTLTLVNVFVECGDIDDAFCFRLRTEEIRIYLLFVITSEHNPLNSLV